MSENPLRELRAKREAITNEASVIAFFGMEVATSGWVRPIGFENHVWLIDHGITASSINALQEDLYQTAVWRLLSSEGRDEVTGAIAKLQLLADDEKIAIINHEHRIFIALVPGMVFLPKGTNIGPALGVEGVSEDAFNQDDFLKYFQDRGFDVTPIAGDSALSGYVNTYLVRDAKIFGLPSISN